MAGKKHKPSWVLGKGLSKKSKGLPRTPEGYPIIRGSIHKFVSELTETELKKMESILADREALREELEKEKSETFEKGTLDIFEEKLKYLNTCQRRLTPLQEKVCRRVWEKSKTHKQIAKELGIGTGNVSTILNQIKNKYHKLLLKKFPKAKGSLGNK